MNKNIVENFLDDNKEKFKKLLSSQYIKIRKESVFILVYFYEVID